MRKTTLRFSPGRKALFFVFVPAGKMEPSFREITKANAMPPQNPELWRVYGPELLGPAFLVGYL